MRSNLPRAFLLIGDSITRAYFILKALKSISQVRYTSAGFRVRPLVSDPALIAQIKMVLGES